MKITEEEYLANALSLVASSAEEGLSETDKELLEKWLKESGREFSAHDLLKLTGVKQVDEYEKDSYLTRIKRRINHLVFRLSSNRRIQIAVIIVVEIKAALYLLFSLLIFLVLIGVVPVSKSDLNLNFDFANTGQFISTLVAACFSVAGAVMFPISRIKAFTLIKYDLLISIFVIQFFNFWINQFYALIGVLFVIITLQIVNRILENLKIRGSR